MRSSGCSRRYPNAWYGYFLHGGLYPAYVRGHAYLEAGQASEAVSEFQKVLHNRGIVLADPIGALAHLQQGRVLLLPGERDRAGRTYRDFFALWRNADPGIPIFNQGKAEFDEMR